MSGSELLATLIMTCAGSLFVYAYDQMLKQENIPSQFSVLADWSGSTSLKLATIIMLLFQLASPIFGACSFPTIIYLFYSLIRRN